MNVSEKGTAADVHAALGKLTTNDATENAVLNAVDTVLAKVAGDRQTTVNAAVEVTATLTRVYLDIIIVPSAADQEAKALAERPAEPAGPIVVPGSQPLDVGEDPES